MQARCEEAQGDGTRPANLVGDLYDLADAIGVGNWRLDEEDEYLWFGMFARFSQVLASFEKARLSGRWVSNGGVREFRGGQDRGKWFYQALAYFLNGYALETRGGFATPPDPSSPAVQITTIHSAKGLQWPTGPKKTKKRGTGDRGPLCSQLWSGWRNLGRGNMLNALPRPASGANPTGHHEKGLSGR